jgi:hypothetical protein
VVIQLKANEKLAGNQRDGKADQDAGHPGGKIRTEDIERGRMGAHHWL